MATQPTMLPHRQFFLILILIAVIIILLWRGCNKDKELKDTATFYAAAQDTLHQTRNELGQQRTSTAMAEAFNRKLFLRFQSQDSSIIKLQEVVKSFKGKLQSASVFSNTTSSIGGNPTIITGHDTIIKDSMVFVYPNYESNWTERWSNGHILATKDSIFRDIKVKNEFEMTMGYEKSKWWKSKQPTVTIKNLNPNTETTELKTFNIKNANKKLGIGVTVSYGMGTASFMPQFFVGMGLNYNLLQIR